MPESIEEHGCVCLDDRSLEHDQTVEGIDASILLITNMVDANTLHCWYKASALIKSAIGWSRRLSKILSASARALWERCLALRIIRQK